MDFVEGLPKSHLKSVVFVVVDRLTKYTHFMALSHPYTATKVANLYLHFVFKLHGMPSTIVSDRDPMFTSLFWREWMKLQGVKLAMSSAYHRQSDGQTKVVNKSLEYYLRAFAADRPSTWVEWLPLAKFWFNTNFHTSIKMIPFETLYGYSPLRVLDYVVSTKRVDAVDLMLRDRQQILSLLKQNLCVAQERVRWFANQKRVERSFAMGDWVYLRLQPYKQTSMHNKGLGKLAPRYYGPFKVLPKVGEVSYKLDLPISSLIYLVFHVSTLRLKWAIKWCLDQLYLL